MITVRICTCDERRRLQAAREFIFDPVWNGWIFPHDPPRQMSDAARYYALVDRSEYKHTDHSGTPVVYVDCPSCGVALPFVRMESPDHPASGDFR